MTTQSMSNANIERNNYAVDSLEIKVKTLIQMKINSHLRSKGNEHFSKEDNDFKGILF